VQLKLRGYGKPKYAFKIESVNFKPQKFSQSRETPRNNQSNTPALPNFVPMKIPSVKVDNIKTTVLETSKTEVNLTVHVHGQTIITIDRQEITTNLTFASFISDSNIFLSKAKIPSVNFLVTSIAQILQTLNFAITSVIITGATEIPFTNTKVHNTNFLMILTAKML